MKIGDLVKSTKSGHLGIITRMRDSSFGSIIFVEFVCGIWMECYSRDLEVVSCK